MNIVRGHCTTNLDDYEMTITQFHKVPDKGDRVTCLKNGYESTLRVHSITHTMRHNIPYIIVELHN